MKKQKQSQFHYPAGSTSKRKFEGACLVAYGHPQKAVGSAALSVDDDVVFVRVELLTAHIVAALA